MTVLDILTCIVSGAALGFLIGLTGVGGGVLTVPVLILIIRLKTIEAVGTASLYAVLARIYAVIKHYRQGTVNVDVGLRFLVGAVPGVICAAVLVKWLKGSLSEAGVEALQNAIGYVIIFSIGFALLILLFDHSRAEHDFLLSRTGRALRLPSVFLIGAIMGATSIGGGILIIPALLLLYGETLKYVGTSNFISIACMIVMSCIYAFMGRDGNVGDVNLRVAVLMSAGSLIGTHYGSALSKKIHPKRLRTIVIAVIVLAAVMMLVDRFG